ncbi:MAG TPA: hypothetical protein VGZ22_18750 [Isosphaeraceae bacterium]|jgi:hypothetical protein|nr:hypothetical protein [Isosphaeraceae bacterium]
MENENYSYRPKCSVAACNQPVRFKVAALWSYGSTRELKNYGLACETHRDAQLARAHSKYQGVHLADGEAVGPVTLYEYVAGHRDAQLAPVKG